MQKYNKAIVAILGGAVTLLAAFGIITEDMGKEMIEVAAPILTAFLVYFIPNK